MNIVSSIAGTASRIPQKPALATGTTVLTYGELESLATRIRLAIAQSMSAEPFVGFLAYRSVTAYASVWGIVTSGKGYVPLNPRFPVFRTLEMLKQSPANVLIVGREASPLLPDLLEIDRPLTVICADFSPSDIAVPDNCRNRHTLVDLAKTSFHETKPSAEHVVPAMDKPAYLLFTSGSTGIPKGVAVSHANLAAYVQYTSEAFEICETDRLSQTFDMTFDLSVHDMFLAWANGACLYCIPESSLMAPTRFIQQHQLTVWFSVPSVINIAGRLNLLKPGCLPSLRLSLFCGEPLLRTAAELWQQAASNSVVENLYGPTEATIAISKFRWPRGEESPDYPNGIVPIGDLFPHHMAAIVDDNLNGVPPGASGELCLSGPQVVQGYLNQPEKTKSQFVRLPGGDPQSLWYRTGDAVVQDKGILCYLGRIDNQVKIRGHPVELQEIEHVLRSVGKLDHAVAISWPPDSANAEEIYAFISPAADIDLQHVLADSRHILPGYMVPQAIFPIESFPLNANGKVDRRALTQMAGELINAQAR